jgi:L-2,4-diaminobutyrate decarboxylase
MKDQPVSNNCEVEKAFDHEKFRTLGHKIVDMLADSLGETRKAEVPVRSAQTPEEAAQFWESRLHSSDQSPEDLIRDALQTSFRSHHPHNLGHQVGPVLPEIALIDLVGSFLDTGNGTFEAGNPATAMERVALKELASRVGMSPETDGILTSGGSLGNLTALLAMRQRMTTSWDGGGFDQPVAVIVSEEAHYCVERAVKIMGWGDAGVIPAKVDDLYRIRVDLLAHTLKEAKSRGVRVIGIIGSACSTATGSFDPLDEIADFCEAENLWFHVDAAHAGGFVFSEKARPLLQGIERADSVVIDFHKMLLGSSLLTAVLFKNGNDSFESFAQKADYLWSKNDSPEWWNAAKRTLECTRPMLGLRAYALLKAGQNGLFESYLDHSLEMTRSFANLIKAADDFILLCEPESNIVCYRYQPKQGSDEDIDQLNQRVRKQLIDTGDFFIVQVTKHGRTYLRSALMNPFITPRIFEGLLKKIRSLVAEIKIGIGTTPSN